MRWATFYYDLLRDTVFDLKVHSDKESALSYFNKHCKIYFQLNSQFKADKLPATYGYATRKYCGISARAFKKEFGCSIDEALKIAESEDK
jgi:AraC-like DNA-binding protein